MRFTAIAMSLALLLVAGCKQEQNVPTAEDFKREREALMSRVKDRKARDDKPAEAAAPAPPSQPTELAFAPMAADFRYDPTDKRDPFRSYEWERVEQEEDETRRGPLEQFDVSQLSVVAVVWKTGKARALVQDPSGQGYIIGMGTRIGKNDGEVVAIDDNLVVVKETYVDFLGHETKKDIEMRIRRSEGG